MATPVVAAKKMRSVEATRAAWNIAVKLSAREHLMLQAIASHADEKFECFPSYDRLAAMVKLSRRQAIRIVHNLRAKGVIEFAENPGGKAKSNHYRLLINGDTPKSETCTNGDISNRNGDISGQQTVTSVTVNGDIAMSPEWFEGFEEWKEWFDPPNPLSKGGSSVIRQCDEAFKEIDLEKPRELETLLRQIRKGAPIQRKQVCDRHGEFIRSGYRWENWIAWNGHDNVYGATWPECDGCKKREEKLRSEWRQLHPNRPEPDYPVCELDLKTPVFCQLHGKSILWATLTEYSEEFGRVAGSRIRIGLARTNDTCPACEAEFLYEQEVRESLELSNEEWKRGGQAIMKAIYLAHGSL